MARQQESFPEIFERCTGWPWQESLAKRLFIYRQLDAKVRSAANNFDDHFDRLMALLAGEPDRFNKTVLAEKVYGLCENMRPDETVRFFARQISLIAAQMHYGDDPETAAHAMILGLNIAHRINPFKESAASPYAEFAAIVVDYLHDYPSEIRPSHTTAALRSLNSLIELDYQLVTARYVEACVTLLCLDSPRSVPGVIRQTIENINQIISLSAEGDIAPVPDIFSTRARIILEERKARGPGSTPNAHREASRLLSNIRDVEKKSLENQNQRIARLTLRRHFPAHVSRLPWYQYSSFTNAVAETTSRLAHKVAPILRKWGDKLKIPKP